MTRSTTPNTGLRTTRRDGFTLVELVVTLGVLMILLGLLLPAVGGARSSAELTGEATRIRDFGLLVESYTIDHDLTYPYTPGSVADVQRAVPELLDAKQFLESGPSLSVDGYDFRPTPVLSMCFHYDWRLMERGNTVYAPSPNFDFFVLSLELIDASRVRSTDVRSPSGKGLAQFDFIVTGATRGHWCCIYPAPKGPVVFADLSVDMVRWVELLNGEMYETENGIGQPVFTTWSGVKGADR